jgi:hypothetical protein
MRRFPHVFATLWGLMSRPTRPGRGPALGLETLDARLLPSTFTISDYPTSGLVAANLGNLQVNWSSQNTIAIHYPNVSSLLNRPLQMVNGNANYGQVTFTQVTINSDGTATLTGTFTSGTLSIPVTGTVGSYHFGGPLGFTATLSISGAVYSPIPGGGTNYDMGYSVTFNGTLYQNDQHASVAGQLQVVVSDDLPVAIMNQPYSPVSGPWF